MNYSNELGANLPVGSKQIVVFIPEKDKKNLKTLREFLHRMGREAKQGEVGVVIDGNYYGISEYDPPPKGGK